MEVEKHDVRVEHFVGDAFGITNYEASVSTAVQDCLNFQKLAVGGACSVGPGFWWTLPLGELEVVSNHPTLRLDLNRKRKSKPGLGLRQFLDVISHSSLITPTVFKIEYSSTWHIWLLRCASCEHGPGAL